MRIYAEPDDLTISEIDQAAIKKGITKKQLVLDAIDFYLHQDRSELDQAIRERDQARSEADQRWKDANQIKSELNLLKRDLEAAKLLCDQLRSEVDQARSLKDQLSIEAAGLRRDLEHYKETLKLKDDEISFLRGHVSQISEKLPKALPPAEEEITKKGWWQFWK